MRILGFLRVPAGASAACRPARLSSAELSTASRPRNSRESSRAPRYNPPAALGRPSGDGSDSNRQSNSWYFMPIVLNFISSVRCDVPRRSSRCTTPDMMIAPERGARTTTSSTCISGTLSNIRAMAASTSSRHCRANSCACRCSDRSWSQGWISRARHSTRSRRDSAARCNTSCATPPRGRRRRHQVTSRVILPA
jgi:hypothetical protein